MLAASIIKVVMILMMGTVRILEMSVKFCKMTWCYIPEDSHLHTHYSEDLKPHNFSSIPQCREQGMSELTAVQFITLVPAVEL
jgi:hypothetical protein